MGSRRHIAGAGDWAVFWPDGRRWLIEVKATKGMWDSFGPADRQALCTLADKYGMTPVLAFRLPGNKIRWVFRNGFPRERD